MGTGGWGLGELGLDLGRGLCCSKQLILLISRPLGFGVGTRGFGSRIVLQQTIVGHREKQQQKGHTSAGHHVHPVFLSRSDLSHLAAFRFETVSRSELNHHPGPM